MAHIQGSIKLLSIPLPSNWKYFLEKPLVQGLGDSLDMPRNHVQGKTVEEPGTN